MAKKFMGFKPETMAKKILPALGYDGPMDSKSIQAFLAASPAAAAKMGKYTMAARRMVEQPVNAATGYGPAYKRPLHTIPVADRGKVALERLGKDIFGRENKSSSKKSTPAPVRQSPAPVQQTPTYITPVTTTTTPTVGTVPTGSSGNVAVKPATGVPVITGSGVN